MTADDLALSLTTDVDRAFGHVVERYQHRLHAFALRLSGDQQDAEEITQDAFVRAYRALTGYPPERRAALALRPWLYQITLNVVRNRQRARRPRLMALDTLLASTATEPRADPADDPETSMLARERQASLARCLMTLPLRYRAAVVLRHVEGLPYAEVAATLAMPVGTVKANVHRGSRLLREALRDAGLAPAGAVGNAPTIGAEEATA